MEGQNADSQNSTQWVVDDYYADSNRENNPLGWLFGADEKNNVDGAGVTRSRRRNSILQRNKLD